MIKVVYPGTFDPLTRGHLDIIERAAALVDRLVIGVAINRDKGPLFSLEDRVAMVRAECDRITASSKGEIVVHPFENLLIDCARDVGATVIVRGLRAVADFEFEFQLASMNRRLNPQIESIFLTPAEQYAFISSSLVREVAKLGGNIAPFVHPKVEAALAAKFAAQRSNQGRKP